MSEYSGNKYKRKNKNNDVELSSFNLTIQSDVGRGAKREKSNDSRHGGGPGTECRKARYKKGTWITPRSDNKSDGGR